MDRETRIFFFKKTFYKKIDLIIIDIYNLYNNNKMTDQEVNFEILNLPIPSVVKTYSNEKQQEIFNYLQEMDDHNRKGYIIAQNHLGTSFNIYKSNGYKDSLKKIKT